MKDMPLTRRRFLEGCAGAGALAAAGSACVITQAFAEGGQIGTGARPAWSNAYTVCEGCANACSLQAYVVDGKLEKTLANAFDPNAAGSLCARGYGYTQSAFSEARVKNPLRRKDTGGFKTLSWDEALRDVGELLGGIVAVDGPEAVAVIYSGEQRNARTLATLFASALGTGNVFVDDVTYDVVKGGALKQTIGVDECYADVANADVVVLIDSSLTDITTPDLVTSLQKAREAGSTIIAIDPRLGALGTFAEDWYPTNPGTELALLLAVCQSLISSGRYDKAFVAENVANFDLWAEAIAEYTPAWAESVTGIESFRIEQLTSTLYEAAPHVAIEYGNGRIAGTSYINSPQTERVICLLNALLGAWGKLGGTYLPYDFDALTPADDADALQKAPSSILEIIDRREGIISTVDAGAALALSRQTGRNVKALIAIGADIAYDYSAIAGIQDRLEDLELFVCIADEMTLTAESADYVLPVSSYLERATFPEPVQGAFAAYSASAPVIDAADGVNARPLGEILDGIAAAAGADADLEETATALVDAQLAACGLDATGVAETGVSAIAPKAIARIATWQTPSGKIECLSAPELAPHAVTLPLWVEPLGLSDILEVVSEDMNLGTLNEEVAAIGGGETPTFKLITGQQSVVGMHGYNTEELMLISEKYGLDSVWINAGMAELLGIADGDEVVVKNGLHTCKATAFVTGRIVPTALYMPMGYGRTADRQRVAKGHGTNVFLFSEPVMVSGSGALGVQEACVSLLTKKEGA